MSHRVWSAKRILMRGALGIFQFNSEINLQKWQQLKNLETHMVKATRSQETIKYQHGWI